MTARNDLAAAVRELGALPMPAGVEPLTLTDDRLAEIQALWAPIPADEQPRISVTDSSRAGALHHALGRAPTDVPALLAEVDRLKAELNCQSVADAPVACPGFEKEYQGESDAKRRLANCKHCGQARKAHEEATS
ncbi:hypothetical protein ABZT43_03975 [Streptomyces sp. NPDC005349]|uniref:hypothetical protein n=1 Tax=Streptomyces sp. NPDC005349 TaxID=3157037 RepID=UPI0033BC59DC